MKKVYLLYGVKNGFDVCDLLGVYTSEYFAAEAADEIGGRIMQGWRIGHIDLNIRRRKRICKGTEIFTIRICLDWYRVLNGNDI